ncbi:metal-dependent hydrolase [Hydrogenophaga sp. 5NK40-0174]|uniref:metal-dependent hydrolase n=1 Tax=Hydrogenophaga sp. 5NK40-0174 TaxID=3127649 RepID=UPI00310A816B
MAVFLHFAPAIGLAATVGKRIISPRLMLAGAACAVLPDVDFLVMKLGGFPYGHIYGHRGFTHSIGFAVLLAVLAWLWAVPWRRQAQQTRKLRWADRAIAASFILLCTLSHPLLDNLINAGICTAWFWPLDDARTCLPWRPISVSGMRMFTLDWLWVEMKWIGLPLLAVAAVARLWRRMARWMKQSDGNGEASESAGIETVKQQKTQKEVLSARTQHQIKAYQAEAVLLRMRLQAIEASGLGTEARRENDTTTWADHPRAQRQRRRLALELFAQSLTRGVQ